MADKQRWGAALTCIRTGAGWLYLPASLALASRPRRGGLVSLSVRLDAVATRIGAGQMALKNRLIEDELVFPLSSK